MAHNQLARQSNSECPAGMLTCGIDCVSPLSDPFNCGACGAQCSNSSTVFYTACLNGTCTTDSNCPSGSAACGQNCIDLSADSYNCGGCGRQCSTSNKGTPSPCVSGVCVSSYPTTYSSLASSTTPATSFSTSTKSPSTAAPRIPTSSVIPPGSGISSGSAAGIGIGCTLLGALLAGLVFFILSRRKRRQAGLQQPHLPANQGEGDTVELARRGLSNEQPVFAELGERHTLQEEKGIAELGWHRIRQKAISKIRGWLSIRDRHKVAPIRPHDAVHVPDN